MLTHEDRRYINHIDRTYFTAVEVLGRSTRFPEQELLKKPRRAAKLINFIKNREEKDYEDEYHGKVLTKLSTFLKDHRKI